MDEQGEGVAIRYPAEADLSIDSRDRYQDPFPLLETTSSEIVFQNKQAYLSGYFTRIALSDLQFQWSTPNINPRNNIIGWQWKNPSTNLLQNFNASITTNFYNLESLAYAIKSAMNLQQTGKYNVIIDISGFTVDVVTTDGSDFTWWIPSDPDLSIRAKKFFRTCGTLKTLFDPLAPQDLNNIITDSASLAYTTYVDFVSNTLAKYSRVKDSLTRLKNNYTNILTRVYMTPFGQKEKYVGITPFTLCVDYSTPKHLRWNPDEYIYDFDITMYDEYGDVLYWSPLWQTEYQCTIHASET